LSICYDCCHSAKITIITVTIFVKSFYLWCFQIDIAGDQTIKTHVDDVMRDANEEEEDDQEDEEMDEMVYGEEKGESDMD
jgi:hypothetical protein